MEASMAVRSSVFSPLAAAAAVAANNNYYSYLLTSSSPLFKSCITTTSTGRRKKENSKKTTLIHFSSSTSSISSISSSSSSFMSTTTTLSSSSSITNSFLSSSSSQQLLLLKTTTTLSASSSSLGFPKTYHPRLLLKNNTTSSNIRCISSSRPLTFGQQQQQDEEQDEEVVIVDNSTVEDEAETSSISNSNSNSNSHSISISISNHKQDQDKEPEVAAMLPKVDKSGRLSSPRAARELALIILYAACLDGSDPVRLFDNRLNARKETGYVFDKASLMEYDHMIFGGPPVTTDSLEEADHILSIDLKESALEAEVLSAPPKLVYSKLILRFTRKLLVAVVENWDNNVHAIDKFSPPNWKNEAASRILEFSVLHLAMSEISVLGTRHQIVINEAVDLSKRFCDGAAPRIINGCLRTFIKEHNQNGRPQNPMISHTV